MNRKSLEEDNNKTDDELYNDAIVAARLALINTIDFATLEEIAPENQVVTSDRYQFDVTSLFELVKTQPLESLANPQTRQEFNERDKQSILKALHEYGKRMGKTVTLCTRHPNLNGDPAYMDTMELVRDLHMQDQLQLLFAETSQPTTNAWSQNSSLNPFERPINAGPFSAEPANYSGLGFTPALFRPAIAQTPVINFATFQEYLVTRRRLALEGFLTNLEVEQEEMEGNRRAGNIRGSRIV